MYLARSAGIRVFATGGIGGVHRGDHGDVSADLPALAGIPVAVVCAGAKAVLDLPRTLEWLETAGVPVIGLGTDEFPAFYSRSSGLPVSARADDPTAVAMLLRQHWDLGLPCGALVCVPCPEAEAVEPRVIQAALEQAEREAVGVRGPALTPHLLARMVDLTGGQALRANLALLQQNARAAAEIAVALA
jgi:pseudouridine-5'-phosphate glycosidase